MIWNHQFCFNANNYIISLQKHVVLQYSTGYYQECSISMNMVMIIFRSVLEIAGNQNIFFWPIWIGRIEIPETQEGVSTLLVRETYKWKILDRMYNVILLFLCSLMRKQWFFEIWRLTSKSRLKKQIPVFSYTLWSVIIRWYICWWYFKFCWIFGAKQKK
jgi:hypothetical protein